MSEDPVKPAAGPVLSRADARFVAWALGQYAGWLALLPRLKHHAYSLAAQFDPEQEVPRLLRESVELDAEMIADLVAEDIVQLCGERVLNDVHPTDVADQLDLIAERFHQAANHYRAHGRLQTRGVRL